MVNHVRTLLINERPAALPAPGDEYVPPGYRPADSAALRAARRALFGPGADRVGMNLTAAGVLAFLHASRFEADVTAADPRATYDPRRPADVWDSLGAAVVALAGPAAFGWGGAAAFRAAGRAYGIWDVTTDGAGAYSSVTSGGADAAGPVVAAASGDSVPLAGSHLSLVVPTGAAGRWRVTLLAPPAHAWPAAAGASGEGVFAPAASEAEARWYAAWSDPFEPAPVRAAALALALAARTHDLITAGV